MVRLAFTGFHVVFVRHSRIQGSTVFMKACVSSAGMLASELSILKPKAPDPHPQVDNQSLNTCCCIPPQKGTQDPLGPWTLKFLWLMPRCRLMLTSELRQGPAERAFGCYPKLPRTLVRALDPLRTQIIRFPEAQGQVLYQRFLHRVYSKQIFRQSFQNSHIPIY